MRIPPFPRFQPFKPFHPFQHGRLIVNPGCPQPHNESFSANPGESLTSETKTLVFLQPQNQGCSASFGVSNLNERCFVECV